MNDVLTCVATIVLFAVALGYVAACDRLKVKKNHD